MHHTIQDAPKDRSERKRLIRASPAATKSHAGKENDMKVIIEGKKCSLNDIDEFVLLYLDRMFFFDRGYVGVVMQFVVNIFTSFVCASLLYVLYMGCYRQIVRGELPQNQVMDMMDWTIFVVGFSVAFPCMIKYSPLKEYLKYWRVGVVGYTAIIDMSDPKECKVSVEYGRKQCPSKDTVAISLGGWFRQDVSVSGNDGSWKCSFIHDCKMALHRSQSEFISWMCDYDKFSWDDPDNYGACFYLIDGNGSRCPVGLFEMLHIVQSGYKTLGGYINAQNGRLQVIESAAMEAITSIEKSSRFQQSTEARNIRIELMKEIASTLKDGDCQKARLKKQIRISRKNAARQSKASLPGKAFAGVE